ncbi:traB domain-containing protein-like isoform X1 [Rhodamnia argentea]|uniref:TraB domain-containing protein-like isoform X1 n=1 Tax=Rhodamnia argentea TaxID=178133 RepID=A0A8B8QDN6_9MYRT|nr:traB domain-containing protein-like isoform X1 [Rhodamnia argentea]
MNCPTRPLALLRSSRSLLSSLSSSTVRTSHPRLRFVSPSKTTRCSLSTIPSKNRPSSIATRPATAMDPCAPEPDSNSVEDFVHIDDPNPNVESLSESFVGVDVAREDDGDEAAYRSGGEGDGEGSNLRRTLPEELSRSVVVLTCESSAEGGTCDVHLVGTAHVSEESCREVEAVISYLKPQVVFLELCPNRVALLTPQNLKVPTFGEMVEMFKKKHNAFGILYSWFLAKVANKLEVYPGAEFRVAFEEAMKYGGKVILGDRPIQVTLRRTWGKMPLWHKIKLIYSLLFQAVFLPSPEDLNKMLKDLDDVDMLTLVIQEMSKEFPTLMETLVHERDQYMSWTLLKVAREHSSVVAVVGKGHLAGIRKHWQQPVVVKDLLEVPSKKPAVSTVKMLSSLGIAVAGVAILSGIYFGWKK